MTFEAVPSICMDPRVHYVGNPWAHGFTFHLRVLTDGRIRLYGRQRRNPERRLRARQQTANRLVYAAAEIFLPSR